MLQLSRCRERWLVDGLHGRDRLVALTRARKDIGLNEKDQKRLRDHLDLAARELSAAKTTRHQLLLTQDVIDAVHDTLHIVSDSSKTRRQGACRMASW